VVAGYIQNTITVGHFKVLGGLRIEGTQASFVGTKVTFLPRGIQIQEMHSLCRMCLHQGHQSYTSFLPSVQVQYNINEARISGPLTEGELRVPTSPTFRLSSWKSRAANRGVGRQSSS